MIARLPLPFRVLLILGIGILLGFGLSVGRPVKAEREIAAAPEERTVPWRDLRLLAEVLEHVLSEHEIQYVESLEQLRAVDEWARAAARRAVDA